MTGLAIFLWSSVIFVLGGWSLARGISEYRSGSAKIVGWPRFDREAQPINFWLAIGGRLFGVLAAALLLTVALAWR